MENCIINFIVLPVASGVIASAIVVLAIHYINKIKLKNDLKKYLGKWTAHPLVDKSRPDENVLYGEVEITNNINNTLDFYHRNKIKGREGLDWQGKLIVNKDYTNTGRLVWQYIETSTYSDLGHKEVILKETKDCYLLYLVGVNFGKQDYGFEVCKKKKQQIT